MAAVFAASALVTQAEPLGRFSDDPSKLRVMQWNILHGGRDDGKEEGPKRVVDVIRAAKPDIVSMQETYGSGEFISKDLGFQFHPRGTNVSIHSRYPVIEDISVYKEFCCSGALLELPDKSKLAFYAVWLGYNKSISDPGSRDGLDESQLLAACKASGTDIAGILSGIAERLKDPKYKDVPVMICGDFNSMSHLDYTAEHKDQFGVVIRWPTSVAITEAGFTDSYREVTPRVDRRKDRTWSPRFPEQLPDRIDYIYYKGSRWKAVSSVVEESHPVKFPSDHAALITDFQLR
ncbi:hypothetical protein llg_15010 [Luteolibacter sp. LG18]|nr:hypothetical protein llg_15010 [Luteolibacter sp. LG18]